MKIFQITAIAMILVAALMTGCRNRNNTTMPSGSSGAPSSSTQQSQPSSAPSSAPDTMPMPSMTMPQGTDDTPATNGTDGILDPTNGSMTAGRGGMRY